MTTASYPSNIINFGPDKVNTVDLVIANDPNTLRAEVVAVETAIGVSPSVSTSAATSSPWYNDGRDYSTIVGRLSNIEVGIVGPDKVFRILTPQEVRDYLDEAN